MLPKKVKKRASLLIIFLFTSVIGIFLILNALNKNILYFKTPTDIKINQDINFESLLRILFHTFSRFCEFCSKKFRKLRK